MLLIPLWLIIISLELVGKKVHHHILKVLTFTLKRLFLKLCNIFYSNAYLFVFKSQISFFHLVYAAKNLLTSNLCGIISGCRICQPC